MTDILLLTAFIVAYSAIGVTISVWTKEELNLTKFQKLRVFVTWPVFVAYVCLRFLCKVILWGRND